ncbi:hypothetical protein CLV49_2145 [Labedella gwakjiensis]|uniref:Uncharacterized protein n=1 Tax=Labedella gwakjiensis TaxID=390269 RepID=A0A2P8GX28_9MICO|nr:hypothetical protein [Labedella gwakjiensis]PSL38520.1 hypothetical protein CLV49_2145 [Labedella gwakjiensis]RUQ86968.1 hypothetical protein ELQ93_08490 [Labedella gwakjiensis]
MSDQARTLPRLGRALSVPLLVWTLLSGTALSGASATTAVAAVDAAAEPSGITVVDIPYRSEIDVSPAEGWTIADCGAITAPEGVGITCEPTTLTFSAPEFDPEFERQDVPVTLTTGRTTLAVVYRVGLAPPEPPAIESRTYPTPFAQGSRVLIPLSDLGISCTLCGAENGPRVVAGSVEPASAGTLGVTSTHLVLAAAPDFTGDAELTVRAVDDLGQESTDATLTVSLYATGPSTLVALHTVVSAGREGSTEIDLASLVATNGEDDPVVSGCGAAVLGTVVCRGDGTAEFRSSGAPVDQFSFSVVTKDGEQATGSVTLVTGSLATAPLPGPADARGRGEAQTVVPARIPVEDAPADETSPFDSLIRLLDRADG